jgi:hypothetical protein
VGPSPTPAQFAHPPTTHPSPQVTPGCGVSWVSGCLARRCGGGAACGAWVFLVFGFRLGWGFFLRRPSLAWLPGFTVYCTGRAVCLLPVWGMFVEMREAAADALRDNYCTLSALPLCLSPPATWPGDSSPTRGLCRSVLRVSLGGKGGISLSPPEAAGLTA